MKFWVYVLINPDKRIYIGQTNDLRRRLIEHNDPQCRVTLYTKRHRAPWRLLHAETFDTRSKAIRREKQLKSAKGREWIKSTLQVSR